MRQRTFRPNRLERTITAFCYVPVSDPEISPDPMVLLVHNISDAQMRRAKGLSPLTRMTEEGVKETGKPAGWGMPGGGMKAEDGNDPETSAETELKGEAGLKAARMRPFLREAENKFIELDQNEAVVDEPVYFEKGKRPSIEIDARHHAIENPIHVFQADVHWEGSALQALLREHARRQVASGERTPNEIAEDGVWVWLSELSTEELDSLGIDELDEIDGIGVFSLDTILTERPDGFYRSHLRRIQKGLREAEEERAKEPAGV
jgi:ADP-ribose pyrophosphatase YjhB (NUDIX family)